MEPDISGADITTKLTWVRISPISPQPCPVGTGHQRGRHHNETNLGADLSERLHRHDWPGNIRELRSVVERAVLLAEGDTITAHGLVVAGLPAGPPLPDGSVEAAARDRVIAALTACGGNHSRAARMLGISRNTRIARIRRYGLVRPRLQDAVR